MSKALENLLPFIIIGVIILFRIVKAVLEQASQTRSAPRREETWEEDQGWETWQAPPSEPAVPESPAPSKPTPPVLVPSPEIAAILEKLAERKRQKQAPQPAPEPVVPAAAPPKAPDLAVPLPETSVVVASPQGGEPPLPAIKSPEQVVSESLAAGFPDTGRMAASTDPGQRQRIIVPVVGRRNLRTGILLAEILGPPRAFDL
jgi:hypothetical protein